MKCKSEDGGEVPASYVYNFYHCQIFETVQKKFSCNGLPAVLLTELNYVREVFQNTTKKNCLHSDGAVKVQYVRKNSRSTSIRPIHGPREVHQLSKVRLTNMRPSRKARATLYHFNGLSNTI